MKKIKIVSLNIAVLVITLAGIWLYLGRPVPSLVPKAPSKPNPLVMTEEQRATYEKKKECEKRAQNQAHKYKMLSGKIISAYIVEPKERCEVDCPNVETFLHISMEAAENTDAERIQITTDRRPLSELKPLLNTIRDDKGSKIYELCTYQRTYDDPFIQQAYGDWQHVALEDLRPRK